MRPYLVMPLLLIALAACQEPVDDTANGQVDAPLADVQDPYEAAGRVTLAKVRPDDWDDLHNVYRLSENVISGSEPHGEQALARIAGMGVKTIVSVDGKVPDQASAASLGMRYVHVPIEYKGITEDELLKLSKTFRELEGPFYVHCFHGKHRGPAGAAVGRLIVDGASREQALAEMRQWCGTSDKYRGLYAVIASTPIPSPDATQALAYDFSPAHELTGFRQAMSEVCRAHDHLKALAAANWEVDPKHPDVDPANEADKLAGLFERSRELPDVKSRPEDFLFWLEESATQSRLLHSALLQARKSDGPDFGQANASLRKISSACSSCHADYRNH